MARISPGTARGFPGGVARASILVAVLLIGSTACGTRVPPEELAKLGSEGGQGLGPGVAGTTTGGGGGKAARAAGTSPTGRGDCTNDGPSDAGVSATRIEVGATYAESSLVPGQFRPAMDAITSAINDFNRAGGWCGRTVAFHFHNDDLNAQTYGENVRHLAEQDRVFAMLGNLSAADSGGCAYMGGQHPARGIPDIGTFALSYCRSQDDSHYSPVGSLKRGIYGCCNEWDWLRSRFHYRKPAVHYLDIEISKDQGLAVVDGLARTLGLGGRGDVFQGEHSPAQVSYTGDVRDMRDAGVDGVWSSMDLNNNVKLLRAMCQQDWRPKVTHLEISAYDPQLQSRVGKSCIQKQNVWIRAFHYPFSSPNPEIQRYVRSLHTYCPGCQPTSFGLEGWLSARLFLAAVKAIGPDLTRPKLYAYLDGVRNWTGHGVMGPNTPSDRLIYHCNVMLHVRPGGFFMERGLGCGKFYRSGHYNGGAVGP